MTLLPTDIIHYNILTKIPAKSLLRFKSVCKDWYNLINSKIFISIHQKHTLEFHGPSDFLLLVHGGSTTLTSTPLISTFETTWFYTYLDAPNYTSGIRTKLGTFEAVVGSFNGLICLKFKRLGFLLCNPVTREHSWFIKSHNLGSVHLWDADYGFGYDVVSCDYKIVIIEFPDYEFQQDVIVHVYSTDSYSWKEAKKIPDLRINKYMFPNRHGKSVVVNNKLHWIMLKKKRSTKIRIILMFDLHTEEFREISYPNNSLKRHDEGVLELTVSGGRLCTLVNHYSSNRSSTVSMWVMKEYGLVESWTKLYEIVGEQISTKHFRIITHLSRRRDSEEVLLLKYDNDQELVWYNLKNKSISGKAVDFGTQIYVIDTWTCIPSLAPIPGNDPNKHRTCIF
ncbi:F-box protein CPR1-like [Silene latifolia]|uniref:F-box protein CPR1-like n=1 Tax=Silene latifolia TaxID=37657 RepID=UPI003D78AB02